MEKCNCRVGTLLHPANSLKKVYRIIYRMILFDKHTWVCSICGQGLTRKSTANRHNNNQHSGGALLVRPYDYIIRMLNGRFLPSDPSLCIAIRVKITVYPILFISVITERVLEPFQTTMYERSYENVRQQHTKSNDVNRTSYAQFGPPLYNSDLTN
jgi:hypothetical protein